MFHIDRKSDVPLKEQIYRQLADRIQTQALEAGSQLPSVRELATRLGVSMVTVVQAYRSLEEAKFVDRIQGKGTFVRSILHGTSPSAEDKRQPYAWQTLLTDYLPRAAVLRQHTGSGAGVPMKMSMASLNPKLAADSLPNHLPDILHGMEESLAEYGPIEGVYSLRCELARYLARVGLSVEIEDLFITGGVQQAIDIVARTFLGPTDVVVVEGPTYAGAIDVFRARGAKVVSIPMDDEGIRMDMLMRQCDDRPPKLVYTMPTYQNPTGIVMSMRRRQQLLDLAESFQFLIMEDDSFSDCHFDDNTKTPMKAMDTKGHIIYAKGLSKVFLAGSRLAAVVASGTVRNRLIAAKSISDLGSPVLTQKLIECCLTDKGLPARLDRIARAVKKKRDIALETLKTHAPTGVYWTTPKGGYNIWVTLPETINADLLFMEAIKHGLSYLPGSACYATELIHHQLRISFAYLDDDVLQLAVRTLCDLFANAFDRNSGSHLPLL